MESKQWKEKEFKVEGYFASFVPHRLNIESRPELSEFPLNVLFVKSKVEDGRWVTGSAVYEPDIATFRNEEEVMLMDYRNIFGGDCRLVMRYDTKTGWRKCEKFINGEWAGCTYGAYDWESFFVNATMPGVVNGERCRFEYNQINT